MISVVKGFHAARWVFWEVCGPGNKTIEFKSFRNFTASEVLQTQNDAFCLHFKTLKNRTLQLYIYYLMDLNKLMESSLT